MGLVFSGRFGSGMATLDRGILDLFLVQNEGVSILYALGGANSGVVSYTLSATDLSVLDWDYYSTSNLVDPISPALFSLSSDVIVYGSADSGDLTGMTLADTGAPGPATTIRLPSDGVAGPQSAILTTELNNGQMALYAIDQARGGLHLYLETNSGWAASGGTYTFQNSGPDAGEALLASTRIGGTEFLLAATSFSDALSVFRVSGSNGTLTQTDTLGRDDGLGVNTPTAIETLSAFGATWVVLAASDSNSISVMRLGADGTLTPTDHVIDTLQTRFAGLSAMASVAVGDRAYLVAGGADDGISLFTLLPDGRLVHLQTIADTSELGLDNVQSIEIGLVGNALQVCVASGSEEGISLFTLDLADLGVSRLSTGQVTGTSGQDLLVANGTAGDTLQGGADDDILVSSAGRTEMTGGAGRDLFVLQPSDHRQLITDFTSGTDRLDLSNWFLLRNISQLEVATSGTSLILGFNGSSVEIRSGSGRALSVADVFPGLTFGTPDHMPLANLDAWIVPDPPTQPAPAPSSIALPEAMAEPGIGVPNSGGSPTDLSGFRRQIGTNANDRVTGSASADAISGGGGADTLSGEGGNDCVWGEDGSDLVFGGAGNDTILGGNGNDELGGGAENDLIRGDAGRDTLWGAGGDDTLFGGADNDQIGASGGNDLLYGEDGEDVLWSGAGNDLVIGGAGRDEAWGGSGNDTVSGGDGNDLIGGGADNDCVMGGAGNDTIWGGTGTDTIWGGDDADQIGGGLGDDHIEGGNGDDTVWGARGDDTILGGAGQDQLWASSGNDLIAGGTERDTLGGGTGNDTLIGEAGDDLLLGGADADVFVFMGAFGADTIADFEAGIDQLAFGAPFASMEDLAIKVSGANCIISTEDGTITLSGISPDSLTPDNIIFAWDAI